MSEERRHMKEKKIRLERDDLARALSVVERIVEAKDKALDPRYGLLLLDVGAAESRLSIVAQNGCQAAISKTTASSESDVRVAVPGKLVIDYVKALPSGGSVTLTAGGKGGKVTSLKVESGAHSCVFPTRTDVGVFDVPSMDEENTSRAVVPGDLFRSVVRAAASVARRTSQSGPLTGVHVVAGEDSLRFQGCDSLQVVVGYADLSDKRDGAADRTAATLPSEAVDDLARHVAADEDVEVVFGEKRVAITCRAGEFYLQQVVGNYPDVERLVPSGSTATAVVSNEAFRQSLKAVAVLSRQQQHDQPDARDRGGRSHRPGLHRSGAERRRGPGQRRREDTRGDQTAERKHPRGRGRRVHHRTRRGCAVGSRPECRARRPYKPRRHPDVVRQRCRDSPLGLRGSADGRRGGLWLRLGSSGPGSVGGRAEVPSRRGSAARGEERKAGRRQRAARPGHASGT